MSRVGDRLLERRAQRRRSAKTRSNKTCNVCGAPATKFKATPPWPGTSYSHTSYTCDAHESYLHGHHWTNNGGGWVDAGVSFVSCSDCGGPYGSCGCPRMADALRYAAWETTGVIGDVDRLGEGGS